MPAELHHGESPAPSPWWAVWSWPLHTQIILGLAVGALLGWLSGSSAIAAVREATPDLAGAPAAAAAVKHLKARWDHMLFDLAGTLFLNGLKMVVVPLVTSSLLLAVAEMGGQSGFARLGLRTLAFYAVTTALATLLGLALVNVIQPGVITPGVPVLTTETASQFAGEAKSIADRAGNRGLADFLKVALELVPANLVKAAADGSLLGLIVVSMAAGYYASRLTGGVRTSFLHAVEGVNRITMDVTGLILSFTPFGVAALVAGTLSENWARLALDDRIADLVRIVVAFFFTVAAALFLHVFLILGAILHLGGVNSFKHWRAMFPAMLTAFSTASSNATLPVTMDCVERRAGVSHRIAAFTVPLGATVNMNGTALYECAAAVFVAQAYGIELTFGAQLLAVTIALLTSIGVPGIPSASLVAIVIILGSVGVPLEGLAVVLLVDRPLDMLRTVVNILGDTCAAVVIAKAEGEQIKV